MQKLPTREILTRVIDVDTLFAELAFLVEHFRSKGYETCEASFGFAWVNDYYSDPNRKQGPISLDSLVAEVHRAGTLGWGGLGTNDLFVKVPPLAPEFRFCNDSDIHLMFDEPEDLTEFFYRRWESLGYEPAEWLKSEQPRSSKRLR